MLINKGETTESLPFQTFDVLLERIDVTLEDVQYRDLSNVVDFMQRTPRRLRYSKFRPPIRS